MKRLTTSTADMQASTTSQKQHLTIKQELRPPQTISLRVYLAAGLTVVLWASAFPGIRAAMVAYTPGHVALLRYAVASLALALYAIVTRMRLPQWRDVPGFILLGITGFTLYNLAVNGGEVHVPSAEASFIVASAPVFIAVASILFLHERLRLWGWLGILVCIAGIATISLSSTQGFHFDIWALLELCAAIITSIYTIAQKRYLQRYTAFECTSYAIWAGTLGLLFFAPGLFSEMRIAAPGTTLAIVYLGIFPGALAYVTWAYALSRLPASRASSFLYLVPIVASGIAWIWLGEVPSLLTLLGGILVLIGVILVNTIGKARARISRSASSAQ